MLRGGRQPAPDLACPMFSHFNYLISSSMLCQEGFLCCMVSDGWRLLWTLVVSVVFSALSHRLLPVRAAARTAQLAAHSRCCALEVSWPWQLCGLHASAGRRPFQFTCEAGCRAVSSDGREVSCMPGCLFQFTQLGRQPMQQHSYR